MPSAEERGATKRQQATCECKSCKKFRNDPNHGVYSGDIFSYSSAPDNGWEPQHTPAELSAQAAGGAPLYYMGVELETMAPQRSESDWVALRRLYSERAAQDPDNYQMPRETYSAYGSPAYRQYEQDYWRVERNRRQLELDFWAERPLMASAEELASMAEPSGFWWPKHDGSVSGPEFASLPATMDYWYSVRPNLETMFTSILHAGGRSFSGDKAGMHISISVVAFSDADHLARFGKLINDNRSWSKRMSQRTKESLSSWCHIGGGAFRNRYVNEDRERSIIRWAEQIVTDGISGGERYNAVNGTCGQGRIEFRLPRGTLRIDRFYKNLEWVHAMIEYTRRYGDTTSATFMRWVMSREQYPDLRAYITEKFHIEPQAEFEPAAAPENENAVKTVIDVRGRRTDMQRQPRLTIDGYATPAPATSSYEWATPRSYEWATPEPDYEDEPEDAYDEPVVAVYDGVVQASLVQGLLDTFTRERAERQEREVQNGNAEFVRQVIEQSASEVTPREVERSMHRMANWPIDERLNGTDAPCTCYMCVGARLMREQREMSPVMEGLPGAAECPHSFFGSGRPLSEGLPGDRGAGTYWRNPYRHHEYTPGTAGSHYGEAFCRCGNSATNPLHGECNPTPPTVAEVILSTDSVSA